MPSIAAAYKGLAGTVQQPEGVEVPLEVFGGLCTADAALELPEGACPDNQNVDFNPGSVLTRAGLTSIFAAIAGNPTINYLKTFTLLNGSDWMLALDRLGGVWAEESTGVLTSIGTVASGCFGQSVTQFGREYMALSDGLFGLDMPRQFDSVNFDRVSQVGPGAAPSAADGSSLGRAISSITQPAAVTINSIDSTEIPFGYWEILTPPGNGIKTGDVITITGTVNYNGTYTVLFSNENNFIEIAATVSHATEFVGSVWDALSTVTLATSVPLSAGMSVVIAAASVAGYDGTQTIVAVTSGTVFSFMATAGNLGAAGAAGTSTPAGNISAGVHKFCISFLTRQGYITKPSPISSWTAAGTLPATFNNLPIGPPNVIARIIFLTSAGGAFFFWIPQPTTGSTTGTLIQDNTSTTATIDFTDATLLSAASIDQPGNNLFNLVELNECLGVVGYSDRLFWWGERNKIQNFNNLSFDGGFDAANVIPLGWTADPTSSAGGSRETTTVVWGFAYRITGDGVTAVRGKISQSAYQDSFNVPIILPNTNYSMRVRLTKNNLAAGTFVVALTSASTGFSSTASVSQAAIVGFQVESIVNFTTITPAIIPTDLVLSISVTGTPTNAGYIIADNLQIFPTNQPFLNTNVRCSYVINPESYDIVSGNLGVDVENGEDIRCLFVQNDNLYIVKENSMFVTSDTGGEPDTWTVAQVSNTVGTLSVHGVGIGERWAVIVGRSGVFMFNGGEPMKMSQEISTDTQQFPSRGWDNVDWTFGQHLWVVNDDIARKVYIGLPLGETNKPNRIYMCNYKELNESGSIASQGPVRVGFSGKVLSTDFSRKWSIWTIQANCAALIERPDGTAHLFLGAAIATGKIYDLLGTSDDGVAIDSYYNTYFFVEHQAEQALGIGTNRKLFKMLSMQVSGVGNLTTTATPVMLNSAIQLALPTILLQAAPTGYVELPINAQGERISFKFRVSALNETFNLSTLIATVTRDPYSVLRGVI